MTIKILNPYAMQNDIDALNIRTVSKKKRFANARLKMMMMTTTTTNGKKTLQQHKIDRERNERDVCVCLCTFNNHINEENCAHN